MTQRFCGFIGLCALAITASLATAQPLTFSHNYGAQKNPVAIAAGSLKNDQYADIVVANYNKNSVTVFLNMRDGSGTFNPGTNINVGTNPHAVVIADFTGDGFADIAVANVGGGVSILVNNGAGVFTQPHAAFPAGPQPFAMAAGAFKDGAKDLVVLNENSGMTILLGHKTAGVPDGTFTTLPTVALTGRSPVSVAVGHFTAGTKQDLAIADMQGHVITMQGNGDGTFMSPVTIANTPRPYAIVDHDFGNGQDNLVVTDYSSKVYVLLNMGGGTFSQSNFPVGNIPNAVTVGRFNGDNKLDIVVANSFDATFTFLTGVGMGVFSLGPTINAHGTLPGALATGSFRGMANHDDLAVANFGDNNISVFFGQ